MRQNYQSGDGEMLAAGQAVALDGCVMARFCARDWLAARLNLTSGTDYS
jgi:hypothetical protein